MKRGLGVLALCLIAMTAVNVSGSAAAEFHSESANTTWTGASEENTVFGGAGATLVCPKASYFGTVTSAKTTSAITFTANWNPLSGGVPTKCSFLFFNNVEVNMNGCDFIYHSNGEMDISGAGCNGITWNAAGCTINIPAQTGLKGLTYANKGAGKTQEITVSTNPVTGISGTGAGLCPKNGAFTNGLLSQGATTFTGEEHGTTTHTGIWWA